MRETPSISHIDRLDLSFAPKPWDFAVERRDEIDAFFAALRRDKPSIWNGRVLMLHHHAMKDGVLHGEYLETDYASFAAWRQWGRPAAKVHDCFSAAAILAADGAFLLGVMGPHTFNGGKIYFPCGTPDLKDIVGDKVDLELSVRRELHEETGLSVAEFASEPGWTMITDGPLMAQIKVLRSGEDSVALRKRVLLHLASEQQPELADIRIIRKHKDLDPAMPRFVTAFLESRLGSS
ncbi:MAG TPA: NUDIX hydrolase [Pseudolabrys sp.]|nr:NUDIX hydrolase [Pseudolabrys sp.]